MVLRVGLGAFRAEFAPPKVESVGLGAVRLAARSPVESRAVNRSVGDRFTRLVWPPPKDDSVGVGAVSKTGSPPKPVVEIVGDGEVSVAVAVAAPTTPAVSIAEGA